MFFRSGEIFEVAFIKSMIEQSKDVDGISEKTLQLLKLMHEEAMCSSHSASFVADDVTQTNGTNNHTEENIDSKPGDKRRSSRDSSDKVGLNPCKKMKVEEQTPQFYYNLHNRQIKGVNLPG